MIYHDSIVLRHPIIVPSFSILISVGSCGGEALVLSLAIGYSTLIEEERKKRHSECMSPLHSDSTEEFKPFGDMGDAIALPSLSSSSKTSSVKYNAFGPSRTPAREEVLQLLTPYS